MSAPIQRPAPETETASHLPLLAEGESCLEILADRLRSSPGIVATSATRTMSRATRPRTELLEIAQSVLGSL
jgi:hypothetical protein